MAAKVKCGRLMCFLLAASMLLCACTVPAEPETDVTGDHVETTQFEHDWSLNGTWSIAGDEDGNAVLTSSGAGEETAWLAELTLEASWEIAVNLQPVDEGCARILLGSGAYEAQAAVSVTFSQGAATPEVETMRGSGWKTVSSGEKARIDPDLPLTLAARHEDGDLRLYITLSQDGQICSELASGEITQRMYSAIVTAGIGADGAAMIFSNFTSRVPENVETVMEHLLNTRSPEDAGFYTALAEQAVADIVANFWLGDAPEGQIIPTWDGYPGSNLPDSRGGLWEAAMLHFCIYDTWVATGDEYYRKLLTAEADFLRSSFSAEELENAGGNQLWASDDCAWNAMLLLNCYQITGDTWFVDRAVNLLDNVVERWYSEELNGIYYKDGADFMSLYEAGIALSWLRLWEITGEQRFYDLALRSYEGMHFRLSQGREDGLYYCEANIKWPLGERTWIGEAGSTSFLSGNMGMAALAAKFYRLTGNEEYLDRVYRINEGMLEIYVTDGGVLINDRDAWTNGTFVAFYVSEVLSLPDTEAMQQVIRDTALSVAANARTDDGYYGGSWSGPSDGPGSTWYNVGTTPQQSKTTGSTVLMITAAALLENKIQDYVR